MRENGFILRLHRAERAVLVLGLVLLGFWGVARFHRAVASRLAIERFRAAEKNARPENLSPVVDPELGRKVDFRLWSNNRITAYEVGLREKKEMPIAILRIPKIDLEVPVFDGTDDLTLNRGVGRIEGTARIGQSGNLGIAGHRDGFFRGLKDVAPGDSINLEAQGKTAHYTVSQTQIVGPGDVQVLRPTLAPTITLVTCFPFYFVGSAPQRFIVTASIPNSSQQN